MKVTILGSGALGKAYGGILTLGGHDVHFLARSEFAAIKHLGYFSLNFKETQRSVQISKPQLYLHADELPPSDLIVIALKTTANDDIPSLMKTCRTDRSIVLVIQNGIGNEEWIAQYTAQSPLLCGISMMGAVRKNAVEVDIAILGLLKLAPYKPQYKDPLASVRAAFAQSPITIPIEESASHRELRWLKLMWNMPFGALALIYAQTTSVLASEEPYASLIDAMIAEIHAIALADGVTIQERYISELLAVTRRNKDYFPSIYTDFKQGHRIEKTYIFDHVLEIANQKQIRTPILHLIERYIALLIGDTFLN